jgi:hypothetical protein
MTGRLAEPARTSRRGEGGSVLMLRRNPGPWVAAQRTHDFVYLPAAARPSVYVVRGIAAHAIPGVAPAGSNRTEPVIRTPGTRSPTGQPLIHNRQGVLGRGLLAASLPG